VFSALEGEGEGELLSSEEGFEEELSLGLYLREESWL
jgi:hypothetical protein